MAAASGPRSRRRFGSARPEWTRFPRSARQQQQQRQRAPGRASPGAFGLFEPRTFRCHASLLAHSDTHTRPRARTSQRQASMHWSLVVHHAASLPPGEDKQLHPRFSDDRAWPSLLVLPPIACTMAWRGRWMAYSLRRGRWWRISNCLVFSVQGPWQGRGRTPAARAGMESG
jgi:hypothetical protein